MDRHNYNLFLHQLNNKDLEAYKLLYYYYYRILVLYAIQFVDQEEIAKDIVQDLFISVWEQELNFDSVQALKTFLYNSVRNRSLNYLKHLQVEEKYVQRMKGKTSEPVDMYLEIEKQEMYRHIFAVIDELPARCKEIFEMHLQGKKNSEIAELLHLSIETVKTQKKRALKQLRKKISPLAIALLLPDILF